MNGGVLLKTGALLALLGGAAAGEVQRVEVLGRVRNGPYERILGRAYYAIDPRLPANRAIADVALAPRDSEGKVEFSGDWMLVRPAAGKSRGTVFLEVVNRGGPQSLYLLDGARGGGPEPEGWDLGDDFLLKQGFTVLFLGWEFDVPPGRGLGLRAPAAPVTGLVRDSYVSLARGAGWKTFDLKYCAADPAEKDARLTYRHAIDEAGETIAREKWHFDDGGCAVTLDSGFDAGLYAAIYHAKDPAVAGLGLAAIRDFASYLKYGPASGAPREDPAAVRRVIGYGYSQSGRVLRQFVRDGFNADERGRQAFDGLMISSAGAGGASVNHRFAMPGEAGNSVLSILRPVDVPPFHDDGLLAKVEAAHVTPRIFYTFSSTEYWARAGSLTTTTPDSADVPLGARSRLYFLSGTPHAAGPFPPRGPLRGERYYANFAQQEWVTRALLMDLDAWIRSGKEPPRSRYPLAAKHELVPREAVRFPKSPAIALPDYMPQVWRMDYGPEFASRGIISNEPPVLGEPYTVLVPQVDADGNDVGGVRLPEIAAPLGTFTGWNVRLPELRSLHFLAGLIGSFEPFPKTREEGRKSGDARRSIAERYAGRQDYLERVRGAAQVLVRERLLLAGDVPAVMERAAAMWDAIAAN